MKKTTMEDSNKIIRRSIYTFLKNYHRVTTGAAIVLPFSAALLLSQPFFSSSHSSFLHSRINKLFRGAGFSSSLEFFNILSLKISETLNSSFFTLPFSLTFFIFSKAYVIKLLSNHNSVNSSVYYLRLLKTYVFNFFFLISVNASVFALFWFVINFLEPFGFSSRKFYTFLSISSSILYSIILANAIVITNLALISSSSSSSGGYTNIIKACLLIRGRTSTALVLALPTNLSLAGIEALFHYRVMKSYYREDRDIVGLAFEGTFIAYLYALVLVLDTIVNFFFYQSCIKNEEDEYSIKIQICETEKMKICVKESKGFHEILF